MTLLFKFTRRAAVALLAAGPLLALSTAHAAFPDKPILIVSPYAPGGAADVLARLLADRLQAQLKATVIVENRPGAGTALGAQAVAKAKPDGYTLLLSASSTFTINPALMPRLSYDPIKSFEPLGMVGSVALALVTNPSVPANTVQQFVQLAKAQPDKYSFGSFGNGTAAHFAGEMFNAATGTHMAHVPYRGSAPAMNDLIGGHIAVSIDTVVAAAPHLKTGKVKVLAVMGAKRSPQLPDVPTVAESGYPGVDIVSWIALVAPRGLPADVNATLQKSLADVMASPGMQDQMRAIGFDPAYRPLPDWNQLVTDDIARMRRIAERAKITME